MLETGYVMLQIRLLIQALTKLLTGQTGEQMDSTLIEAEAVGKSMGLMDLAAQGRINEVENRFCGIGTVSEGCHTSQRGIGLLRLAQ